jgi:hypothetical protein
MAVRLPSFSATNAATVSSSELLFDFLLTCSSGLGCSLGGGLTLARSSRCSGSGLRRLTSGGLGRSCALGSLARRGGRLGLRSSRLGCGSGLGCGLRRRSSLLLARGGLGGRGRHFFFLLFLDLFGLVDRADFGIENLGLDQLRVLFRVFLFLRVEVRIVDVHEERVLVVFAADGRDSQNRANFDQALVLGDVIAVAEELDLGADVDRELAFSGGSGGRRGGLGRFRCHEVLPFQL